MAATAKCRLAISGAVAHILFNSRHLCFSWRGIVLFLVRIVDFALCSILCFCLGFYFIRAIDDNDSWCGGG